MIPLVSGAQPVETHRDPVVINGISVPSDFPWMHVSLSDDPSPGYLFLNNWGGTPYAMILDNTGAPLRYWRSDRRQRITVQDNGLLSMYVMNPDSKGGPIIYALNTGYEVVDTLRASPPYITDEHELKVLEDGSYYLIGRLDSLVDMSAYVACGRPNVVLRRSVVQGFTPEGRLDFVWDPRDHFSIAELEVDDPCGLLVRFPHINSVDIDEDGHILVSSRHFSEVTKVDRQTGEVIWRLGGVGNQFTFLNDPFDGFTNQHDFRALGNGRYTVFDNGNRHTPNESRAAEYELDTSAMTATLVWQFRSDPPRYTNWMGNAQRLPSGNTLINYADRSLPKVVEVRPDGTVALEMDYVVPANTYRVFKHDWIGKATTPYLVVETQPTTLTLIFNKFGDSDVDSYIVYGAHDGGEFEVLASSMQPFAHLSELENGALYTFYVTAVNAAGEESGPSNRVTAVVRSLAPGANMVRNGDFSLGPEDWDFEISDGAQASFQFSDSVLTARITDGGEAFEDVRATQSGLPLFRGHRYVFQLDAWAEAPRLVEAQVVGGGGSGPNYGRIGLTWLTTRVKHVAHEFVMEDADDLNAAIVLNLGDNNADVYVDNISLNEVGLSVAVEQPIPRKPRLRLHPAYPNPTRTAAQLRYETNNPGRILIRLYTLLGREVETLVDDHVPAGVHVADLNTTGLAPGMYLAQLTGNGERAAQTVVVLR